MGETCLDTGGATGSLRGSIPDIGATGVLVGVGFADLPQPPPSIEVLLMAKPATVKIRMVSSAGTGFFYVTKKNPRTQTEKMTMRKYDPRARKHVEFKEAKIK